MKIIPTGEFKDWIRVEHVIIRKISKSGLVFNAQSVTENNIYESGRALEGEYKGEVIMFHPNGFRILKYGTIGEPVCLVRPSDIVAMCVLGEDEEAIAYDIAKDEVANARAEASSKLHIPEHGGSVPEIKETNIIYT